MLAPLDYALRDLRVLVRRAAIALRDREAFPDPLPRALDVLGEHMFSATVVLAQLRSTTVDPLQATGMTRDAALAVLPATRTPPWLPLDARD